MIDGGSHAGVMVRRLKVGIEIELPSCSHGRLIQGGHDTTLLVFSNPLFEEVGLPFQTNHVHP
jgi:hypothetical protein